VFHLSENSNSGRRSLFIGLVLATGLISGGVAFLWGSFTGSKTPTTISPAALYSVQFRGADGKPIALGQWQGKVLLLNFWATWCAPCREEIPSLIEVQRRFSTKGVQVVGIAIDTPEKIGPFSQEMGINYPIVTDEEGGISLSKRLGNRASVLPFTAIVDRQGRVIFANTGALTSRQIEEQIKKVN
jgi:peroxiredoxin